MCRDFIREMKWRMVAHFSAMNDFVIGDSLFPYKHIDQIGWISPER